MRGRKKYLRKKTLFLYLEKLMRRPKINSGNVNKSNEIKILLTHFFKR